MSNPRSSKSDRGNLVDRDEYQQARRQRLTEARRRADRRQEADPSTWALIACAVRVDRSLLEEVLL